MNRRTWMAAAAALALAAGLLAGCANEPAGAAGGETTAPRHSTMTAPLQKAEDYSRIYQAVSPVILGERGYTDYDSDRVVAENNAADGAAPGAAAPRSTAAAKGESASRQESYSDTNLQVDGVQEADVVKTDGRYIYLLSADYLVILEAREGRTSLISRLPVEDVHKAGNTSYSGRTLEMYVTGDRLILIRQCCDLPQENEALKRRDIAGDCIGFGGDPLTEAVFYDISDRTSPRLIQRLGQSGSYLSSRMVGQYLYVISQHWMYGKADEKQPETFVPSLLDGGGMRPVPAGSVCISGKPESAQYLVVTGADAKKPEKHLSSQSVLDVGNTVYATESSLYIAVSKMKDIAGGGYEDITRILRFSMDKGRLRKQAEGQVPGHILNQFSMDEYKDHFRIVTTAHTYSAMEAEESNNLYVLDASLKVTGKLEKLAPGERVYSVRFDGDTGYFVTFRQVDPLFTVDLRDPAAPAIQSKLKIPGFSEYLHPWNGDLLFGLGRDADEASGRTGGLKLSMFHVADPRSVTEQNKALLGMSYCYSEALYNHKAVLIDPAKNLIGFSVQKNGAENLSYMVYTYDKEKGFIQRGELTFHDTKEYASWMRGLYIGDYLYVVTPQCVKAYRLSSLEQTSRLLPGAQNTQPPASQATSKLPASTTSQGTQPPVSVQVQDAVKIMVSTLPESKDDERLYTSKAKIDAVLEYLEQLPLIDTFPENPDTYSGMTYVITVFQKDGGKQVFYHFGNLFLRRENEDWKRMNYEDAQRLGAILRENPSD